VEAWLQSKQGLEEYTFDRLWHKNFNGQGNCIYWDDTLNLIATGCDNGLITILKIDPKSPGKYKEFFMEKVHKACVTGLYIDSTKELLYSIGEDKQLIITSLKSRNKEFCKSAV